MMEDKEILYQILGREIDKLLVGNQMLRMFSEPIKTWVFNFIDPYVDAFFMGTDHLNTQVAGEFVKQEVNNKVDNFIKEFHKKSNS